MASMVHYKLDEKVRNSRTQKNSEESFPDSSALVSSLRTCAKKKNLHQGINVHAEILRRGLFAKCPFVSSALVSMYAKCGALVKAKELLEALVVRDVVAWNALLAGYAQGGHGIEALKSFQEMHCEGLSADSVTYACILKACGNIRDLNQGEKIHFQIIKHGLLNGNVVLGGALVGMYAKCGALVKAKQVLGDLLVQDVVSWNALIVAYAQGEQAEEALNFLEQMQNEGISPDVVTFSCILKACGSIGAISKGKRIHSQIVTQGLLEGDVVLGSAVVDMYAKCGALEKAKEVLEELPVRNVVSWSALIMGCTEAHCGEEALNCFKQMQNEGISPDVVAYACTLRACGIMVALDVGKEIHAKIIGLDLLDANAVLGNALVDMYAKCNALDDAREMLDGLHFRTVISWCALIAGYTEEEHDSEALNCFDEMYHEGVSPDAASFACSLKACGSSGALDVGRTIHAVIVSMGLLDGYIELGNALVGMYAKCGAFADAKEVHEHISIRDVVSWNALISGYTQAELGEEALAYFTWMLHEGLSPTAVTFRCVLKACGNIGAVDKGENMHFEIVRRELISALGSELVDMYAEGGALARAKEVHEVLSVRDVSSWNALIAGYEQKGHDKEALKCYHHMLFEGVPPDALTFASILQACGGARALDEGVKIHVEIVRLGLLGKNVAVGNALVDMYAKCCALVKAKNVFEELALRDVVSWNALITGYAQAKHSEKAWHCFQCMQQEGYYPDTVTLSTILKACGDMGALDRGGKIHSDIVRLDFLTENVILGNALVDMYVKCGSLLMANEVLGHLPVRDAVSWNALIAGYAQGHGKEALNCFELMQCEGLCPDAATFSCVLKACCNIGALGKAQEIHARIVRQGLLCWNVVLGNSMVDLYARCGAFVKARDVLEGLMARDVGVWTALIAGYMQEEHGKEALSCFEQMQCEGIFPNEITFICVLSACSYSGLLYEGQMYFSKMSMDYGIIPKLEHHACLASLFGHAGLLDKAAAVVMRMPSNDYAPAWFVLLSACKKWGNANLGKWAFECFMQLSMTQWRQHLRLKLREL